jgi:hypothetical protein
MRIMKKLNIHMVTALAEMNLIYYGLHYFGSVTLFGLSLYAGTVALALAVLILLIHCLIENHHNHKF